MVRSVSFAHELVSDIYYIPRLSASKIPEYFYSAEDVQRFRCIWKSIIHERMTQLENDRQKRTNDDVIDKEEQLSATCAKRRRCTVEKQSQTQSEPTGEQHEFVEVLRSVSPIEQVDSR